MPFHKIQPVISYENFLSKVEKETNFTSSQGKRYLVTGLENEILYFKRFDANPNVIWDINLKKLYQAYIELDSYATEQFKTFVPRRHSPGRGLLIKLHLIGS